MTFEFATAGRIVFGVGKRVEALRAAAAIERRGLLVCGSHPDRAAWASGDFLVPEPFPVAEEPTIERVSQGAELAQKLGAGFIIAVGGGSVLDAGKAIAALATNPGSALDYLEVIGAGRPLTQPPLPFIAVPTTAGTGAEVTRNAVLASPEHRVKVSLRSPKMLPTLAVVDPELTYNLPPPLTAATGMDALTQLIEPYLCSRANPLTDALCREAIPKAARALPRAFAEGKDVEARSDMALASLFGGLALANAGLGAVHGFAAPLGGMFPAPHGAVCAALLPHALKINLEALRQRTPNSPALERFHDLAGLLTGKAGAHPEEGIEGVASLCASLAIPPLRTFGVSAQHFAELTLRAKQASSMKANPIELTGDELSEILARAT